MATLYDTAKNARKVFLIILIFVFAILSYDTLSRLFQRAAQQNTNAVFSFYIAPDNALGNIPKLEMKSISIASDVKPVYSLDSNQSLFPDVAYVYKIEKPREKLTTIENSIKTASVLGFTAACQTEKRFTDRDYCFISGDDYEWTSQNRTKVLRFNKSTQIWTMNTLFADNVEAKKSKTISLDINVYASPVKTLVTQLGFGNSTGLANGFLALPQYADVGVDGSLFKPDRDELAKYVFLNINRILDLADIKSADELSSIKDKAIIPKPSQGYVYNSNPDGGIFSILATNRLTDYTKDIFKFNFRDFEYSQIAGSYTRGNYLIIRPDEAWSKAQSGRGFLVSIIPENRNPYLSYPDLSVRRFVADASKTELGYYEPEEWNGFVYPVYIFKGRAELSDGRNASFKMYVEALKRAD